MPKLITALDLAARLQEGKVYLLDVREPWEAEQASIPGTTLLAPLSQFPRAAEGVALAKGQALVVYCHHGVRSFRAAQVLEGMLGFEGVYSLTGGIDAWSQQVAPDVPRY